MAGTIHILFITDEAAAANALEREDGQFDVTTVTSGAAARDRLATMPVDCIVSKYGLPDTTGVDLLAAVREDHPELPFVLVTDRTDADLVEIDSGASGNGSQLAFDPHAVTVSTGTTVRWSWTGKGGGHNIVFRDGDFGSEPVRAEPGVHFEETFAETGVFRYACEPHHALGHRGAVIVE